MIQLFSETENKKLQDNTKFRTRRRRRPKNPRHAPKKQAARSPTCHMGLKAPSHFLRAVVRIALRIDGLINQDSGPVRALPDAVACLWCLHVLRYADRLQKDTFYKAYSGENNKLRVGRCARGRIVLL